MVRGSNCRTALDCNSGSLLVIYTPRHIDGIFREISTFTVIFLISLVYSKHLYSQMMLSIHTRANEKRPPLIAILFTGIKWGVPNHTHVVWSWEGQITSDKFLRYKVR